MAIPYTRFKTITQHTSSLPRAGEPTDEPDETNRRRQRSVLIVDDDAWMSAVVADLLVSDGFRVLQTGNGRDAARLAREHQPDVILLDLVLPGRPGLEVLAELKASVETCTIPVVVVSGSAKLMLSHEVRRVDAVVDKPFDVAELLKVVQRAIAKGAVRQSRLVPLSS